MDAFIAAFCLVGLKAFGSSKTVVDLTMNMNLSYGDPTATHFAVGLGTPQTNGASAPVKDMRFFCVYLSAFCNVVSMVGWIIGQLRLVAPFGDSSNSVIRSATLNLELNDGSYPNSNGELVMPDAIAINDTILPIVTYKDQQVLTFNLIDQVHDRVSGTARKRFNDNQKHFIENEDFYVLDSNSLSEFRTNGFDQIPEAAKRATLITESGYLMLVKSFTDDLAWQVQKELVRHYFRHQFPTEPRISSAQRQELTHAIRHIAYNDSSMNQWVYNRLRHHFSILKIEDLAASEHQLALTLIETMKADQSVYYEVSRQLDEYFCKEIIGGGKSWTPTLKGKFKKLLNEQLPARPDWEAIEQQLKQLTKDDNHD